MADNAKWFVVHTYSGYENKVASNIKTVAENRNLQNEILDVVIPSEVVKVPVTKKLGSDESLVETVAEESGEGTDGKSEKYKLVEHKLFPGYVFIKAVSYKKKEPTSSRAIKAMSEGRMDEYLSDYEEVVSMSDEAWYVIRNTRGVTGFVGPDSKPSPLKDEELKSLGLADVLTNKDDDDDEDMDDFLDIFNVKIEVNYSVGDKVTVTNGLFEGMSGVVKSIDLEKETVTVTLPVMGRETPTELSLSEVELA